MEVREDMEINVPVSSSATQAHLPEDEISLGTTLSPRPHPGQGSSLHCS